MVTAATARGRKTQEAGAPTPAPAIFINSSSTEYNLTSHRVQRLIAQTGVSPLFASIAAPLIFGGAA